MVTPTGHREYPGQPVSRALHLSFLLTAYPFPLSAVHRRVPASPRAARRFSLQRCRGRQISARGHSLSVRSGTLDRLPGFRRLDSTIDQNGSHVMLRSNSGRSLRLSVTEEKTARLRLPEIDAPAIAVSVPVFLRATPVRDVRTPTPEKPRAAA